METVSASELPADIQNLRREFLLLSDLSATRLSAAERMVDTFLEMVRGDIGHMKEHVGEVMDRMKIELKEIKSLISAMIPHNHGSEQGPSHAPSVPSESISPSTVPDRKTLRNEISSMLSLHLESLTSKVEDLERDVERINSEVESVKADLNEGICLLDSKINQEISLLERKRRRDRQSEKTKSVRDDDENLRVESELSGNKAVSAKELSVDIIVTVEPAEVLESVQFTGDGVDVDGDLVVMRDDDDESEIRTSLLLSENKDNVDKFSKDDLHFKIDVNDVGDAIIDVVDDVVFGDEPSTGSAAYRPTLDEKIMNVRTEAAGVAAETMQTVSERLESIVFIQSSSQSLSSESSPRGTELNASSLHLNSMPPSIFTVPVMDNDTEKYIMTLQSTSNECEISPCSDVDLSLVEKENVISTDDIPQPVKQIASQVCVEVFKAALLNTLIVAPVSLSLPLESSVKSELFTPAHSLFPPNDIDLQCVVVRKASDEVLPSPAATELQVRQGVVQDVMSNILEVVLNRFRLSEEDRSNESLSSSFSSSSVVDNLTMAEEGAGDNNFVEDASELSQTSTVAHRHQHQRSVSLVTDIVSSAIATIVAASFTGS